MFISEPRATFSVSHGFQLRHQFSWIISHRLPSWLHSWPWKQIWFSRTDVKAGTELSRAEPGLKTGRLLWQGELSALQGPHKHTRSHRHLTQFSSCYTIQQQQPERHQETAKKNPKKQGASKSSLSPLGNLRLPSLPSLRISPFDSPPKCKTTYFFLSCVNASRGLSSIHWEWDIMPRLCHKQPQSNPQIQLLTPPACASSPSSPRQLREEPSPSSKSGFECQKFRLRTQPPTLHLLISKHPPGA